MADRRPWRGPPLWGDILDRTEPREVYLRVFPPGKDGMPMELGITGLPFWEKRTIGSPPLRPEHPLSLAQLKKRAAWWLYCATTEDLQPKGWRPEKEPPARVQSPLDWYCVRCGKKLTRGWWLCAACEAELNCKGGDLTEDNPRCQPGGDLHLIYELKCIARADKDRARAAARREISVDPDILLSPKSHDPDEREEGWDAPSELSATFAPERDDDAITMDDVAVTQRLATGYYGQAGRLAVEHSWNAPKRRVYDAWRYTRSEYATDLTLWEPYPDQSLNKQYRKAYKGRLYRKRQAKRATETADGAEERLDGWRAELERLLAKIDLSPAERQILELARKGERQVDIAATMGLSQSRVSQVLSAALAKLRGPQARPARDPWRRIIRPKEPPAPTGGHVVTAGPYRTDALRSYWQDNPDKASWRETPKHLR